MIDMAWTYAFVCFCYCYLIFVPKRWPHDFDSGLCQQLSQPAAPPVLVPGGQNSVVPAMCASFCLVCIEQRFTGILLPLKQRFLTVALKVYFPASPLIKCTF